MYVCGNVDINAQFCALETSVVVVELFHKLQYRLYLQLITFFSNSTLRS